MLTPLVSLRPNLSALTTRVSVSPMSAATFRSSRTLTPSRLLLRLTPSTLPLLLATMSSATTRVVSSPRRMAALPASITLSLLSATAMKALRATTSSVTPGTPPGVTKVTSRSAWPMARRESAASTRMSTTPSSEHEPHQPAPLNLLANSCCLSKAYRAFKRFHLIISS